MKKYTIIINSNILIEELKYKLIIRLFLNYFIVIANNYLECLRI